MATPNTPARIEGLRCFAVNGGRARESNCTDIERRFVYWQTRAFMSKHGWIRPGHSAEPIYELTDLGNEVWAEYCLTVIVPIDPAPPTKEHAMTDPAATLELIPLDSLIPAEDNPRTAGKDPELVALAASMQEVGILEPLLVEPHPFEDGSYRIVAGHRRFAAAEIACLPHAPCIVRPLDDAMRQATMFIENFHRKDLGPIEQARALKQLADTGIAQRDIAKRVGISQSHVSKLTTLLKLPEEAQGWVEAGKMTQEMAGTLAALPAAKVKELVEDGIPPNEWKIEQAQREVERAKAVAKAHETVKAEGWQLVDVAEWEVDDGEPAVALYLDDNRDAPFGTLAHFDPADHQSEPCHAVIIEAGVIQPVCTNPAAHPRPKDWKSPQELKLEAIRASRSDGALSVRDVTPKTTGELAAVQSEEPADQESGPEVEGSDAEGPKTFQLQSPKVTVKGRGGESVVICGECGEIGAFPVPSDAKALKAEHVVSHQSAPLFVDPGPGDGGPAVVTVFERKKRWYRECSKCGELDGMNTRESDARKRGDSHIADAHSEQLEQAS